MDMDTDPLMISSSNSNKEASTTDAFPRRSSVLFALGELTEQTRQTREDVKAVPDQVFALVGPRLVALESWRKDEADPRIRSLEQERWVLRGGLGLGIVLVGWLVAATKPIMMHFGN